MIAVTIFDQVFHALDASPEKHGPEVPRQTGPSLTPGGIAQGQRKATIFRNQVGKGGLNGFVGMQTAIDDRPNQSSGGKQAMAKGLSEFPTDRLDLVIAQIILKSRQRRGNRFMILKRRVDTFHN